MNARWNTRLEMIRSFGSGLVGAEIGVYRGKFSAELATTSPKELHLVDPWQAQSGEYERDPTNQQNLQACYGGVFRRFSSNPAVHIHRMTSVDASKLFADGYFDYVYLDADHTWQGITVDLPVWWRKVKSGGWLCGHDYFLGCSWVDVQPVVDAWAKIKNLEILTSKPTSSDDPASWAIRKP